jgi:nucleotide-binding universal stress UspA family protein
MYKHILIATDGSELAQKAVQQGLTIAKALGSKATIATVTEPWTAVAPGEIGMAFPVADYEKSAADHAAAILEAAKAQAAAMGATCDVLHVKDRYPADGIIEAAKAQGCDLIVMASHGRRGVARVLIGSQANRVVIHSTIPVLICK